MRPNDDASQPESGFTIPSSTGRRVNTKILFYSLAGNVPCRPTCVSKSPTAESRAPHPHQRAHTLTPSVFPKTQRPCGVILAPCRRGNERPAATAALSLPRAHRDRDHRHGRAPGAPPRRRGRHRERGSPRFVFPANSARSVAERTPCDGDKKTARRTHRDVVGTLAEDNPVGDRAATDLGFECTNLSG